MSIMSCVMCSVEFAAKSKRAMYCSQRCKDKGKPSASGLTCAVCGGVMQKGATSLPQGQAAHNKCREGSNLGVHGNSGYRRGCRCDICREGARLAMREYVAQVKAREGVSPTQKARPKMATGQHCIVCSGEMKRVALTETPMHKECRTRRTPGLLHKRFRAKIDKAAAGTTGGKRVFVSGGCAWCSETFTAAAGVYCSDKCKVSAGFKRRSGGKSFTVSPRVRAAIYERDSWCCQLCNYPVDGSLHHRDNWSASLDHIIPQSHMLIPDHSPSNLRLVHRMCNSMRGDGSNMTEAEFHRRVNDYFEEVAA